MVCSCVAVTTKNAKHSKRCVAPSTMRNISSATRRIDGKEARELLEVNRKSIFYFTFPRRFES